MHKIYIFIPLFLIYTKAFSQKDTIGINASTMEEVVITSNRTETKLGNVAVPVTIIKQKTIEQAGTLRLKDILQEQTGLYITNGFGAGVQMQGLNPDYTLILLNGEPMVGRTAGVLDLNRISISNIKKIEIVKGPSSSLYGSEAMAGVINIITDQSFTKSIEASVRYGFGNPDKGWSLPTSKDVFKNADINFSYKNTFKKTGIQFSTNAYYIDGISYRPYSSNRIPQPIYRNTNQFSLNHSFTDKTKFNLAVRNGYDYIKQEFAVYNLGAVSKTTGKETNNDFNLNATLSHQFDSKIKSLLRIYTTTYNGLQKLNFSDKPDSSYNDQFKQQLYRIENQTDISLKNSRITFGGGYTIDQANSTRYDDVSNTKRNNILYGFVQHEWKPFDKLIFITGLRYDHNKLFEGAASPKFAFRYNHNKKVSFTGSIGRGFKAPDFRQLYLDFTNNAAGGYSVFGCIDAVKIINEMQQLGQIGNINPDFYKLSDLKPEFSTGINLGSIINPLNNLEMKINLFRNDISDMIDVRQVATKLDGAQIFSYINIKKAYTEGIEIQSTLNITKQFSISAGYQYLITADKDEISRIKNRAVYTVGSTGDVRLLEKNEYKGLSNRSNHLANIKFNYENKKGIFGTFRVFYKSKWYISDTDGNGLINSNDESAKGYFMTNISAGKELGKLVKINIGIDNLFNYQDINYLPNTQGRMIYITTNIKFK